LKRTIGTKEKRHKRFASLEYWGGIRYGIRLKTLYGVAVDFTNQFIFLSGLLLCLSIMAGVVSKRTGAPLLLAFLGVGVLFGQDGPGGIIFNDMQLSYTVCSFALAIILFDGGIHTPLRSFRHALRPAFSLATLGVLLTTGIAGGAIWYFLQIEPLQALLLGALFASTDAAAVFLLLRQRGVKLDSSISNTLEVESGINDPMAIFLTLTFVELIMWQGSSQGWQYILGDFIRQMGIGAAFGFAGGRLLTWFFDRVELDSGLYPIFALAGGLFVFGATNLLGGSGFLAVYIAGLLLGNHDYASKKLVQQFMDGIAWLSQLGMLLVLGLLVTPTEVIDDIPTAIIIAAILIFIARPAAVFLSLALSRFNWREKLFISWVGLRGAIPIYLAIIPVMLGVSGNYFNLAFVVVICSLLLQGWSIRFMANLLRVVHPAKAKETTENSV
jgi:cell volume regulation protein A